MERAAEFEQQVAAYFRLHHYEAATNRKLEGRSGAVHEIDVLARRSDGITEFSVAVECKAWATPIEKDVVSRLAMVIADTGINKGIIASLHGWRVGAEQAARQAGIELWGSDELAQRLGAVKLAELGTPTRNRRVVSALRRIALSADDLDRAAQAQSGGVLGIGREEQVWASMVWIPFHLIGVRYSTHVKEFLRRSTTKVAPLWLVYSALNDTRFAMLLAQPALADEAVPNAVPPRTKPKVLTDSLTKTLARFHQVSTSRAKAKYADRLKDLGLPDGTDSLTVETVALVYHPFWVSQFRRRGQERLVAINAASGLFDPPTSVALTENLSFVGAAVRPADK